MMTLRLVILAGSLLWIPAFIAFAVTVPAIQEPEPSQKTDVQKRVAELAKLLDADKETDRDAAEKELLEIGTDAIEFLPVLDVQASAELRMRIERIRDRFVRESTLDFHEPAMVNIKGAMSVLDALSAIEKQTRNPMRLESYKRAPALEEVVDLDIQGVTYWEAIDEVLEEIDWQVVPKDNSRLSFGPRIAIPEGDVGLLKNLPKTSMPPIYIGVLRMQPISLSKTSNFLNPVESTAELELMLHWETRFNPVFVRFPSDKIIVRTDNDEVLPALRDQSSEYIPIGSQLIASMSVLKPTPAATKIASWKGELQIAIPGRVASIDFQDLKQSSGKSLTTGDLTVILEAARKNRDLQEIQIGVSLVNQPSNEVLQGWVNLTDGYLIDQDGNKIENAGWSTTRLTKNDIGLSYLFDIEGELSDYRFVYRAPESVIIQTVDYEFNNIPLP